MRLTEWIIQNRTSCSSSIPIFREIGAKKSSNSPTFGALVLMPGCSPPESTLRVAVPPLSEPGPCLPPLVPKACKQLDRLCYKGDCGTMRCVLGW